MPTKQSSHLLSVR